MRQQLQNVFQEHRASILGEAGAAFGIPTEGFKPLGSFESAVFEFQRSDQAYILKITHQSHRTADQIAAELHWTGFLAQAGMPVPRPEKTVTGDVICEIQAAETRFYAYAFTKAPGRYLNQGEFSDDIIQAWGATLGRMHRLTKEYRPEQNVDCRPHWHEEDSLDFRRFVSLEQVVIHARAQTHLDYLRTLPVDRESYGLCHCDLHQGNFYVDSGQIYPFDFDDAGYHWFAFDITIPLFYAMRSNKIGDGSRQFAARFIGNFLEGYTRENYLQPGWLLRLPGFLKLRELQLYCLLSAEPAERFSPWAADFMDGRRERIEQDLPVTDLDFSRLV
ncbi:MAG: phosphotransferase [bacterium]